MELTETVDSINKQLIDLFGIDTISGNPIFRVVWSDDQYEKRLTNCTKEGLDLLYPEVRLLPKYKQWIEQKYILERLTIVPEINSEELPDQRLSYEPIWVFETNKGVYLPPSVQAAKFVIDTMYAAMGKSNLAKYKDPDSNQEEAIHNQKVKIEGIVEDLFGNETEVGDALAYGEGVGYTGPSKIN